MTSIIETIKYWIYLAKCLVTLEPFYIRKYGWPWALAFALCIGVWVRPPQACYVDGVVPWYFYVNLVIMIWIVGIVLGYFFGMIPIAGYYYWFVYAIVMTIGGIVWAVRIYLYSFRLARAIIHRINWFIQDTEDRMNAYWW
ncbi:MAG: hypothetical protein KatS3mg024_2484 [Armatimonadota bacterium]|nr:MAG: hypothetical protein KatS3mg024_2484 [Armatimonadota bacterium]